MFRGNNIAYVSATIGRLSVQGTAMLTDDEPAIGSTSGMDRGTGTEERVAYEQSLEMVDEIGTTVEADGSEQEVAATNTEKSVGSKHSNEEQMSLDDMLMQISEDMMLPSVTAAEVTKIRLAESIAINEVQERDWYYANLPRISTHDKGKETLEEDEPVNGNPARERVELIRGDVDFLVQLRDQVMKDVDNHGRQWPLKLLICCLLSILNLLKISRRSNKNTGLKWFNQVSSLSSIDSTVGSGAVLDQYFWILIADTLHQDNHGRQWPLKLLICCLLSILNLLKISRRSNKNTGLKWFNQVSSLSSIDSTVGSGAVLDQFYSMAKSTCWVRPMILIDGIWTPILGTDYWTSSCRLSLFVNRKQVPERVVDTTFIPHGFLIEPVQYGGAASSLIKTWGWARVCTEIVRYSMFGCLRPVSENFCRDIVVFSSAVDILEKLPTSFRSIFQQGVYTDSFVDYFSSSDVQNIAEVDLVSSDGSTVYRSTSPQHDSFTEVEFIQRPDSPTHTDSPMHFDNDDIPLDATTDHQILLPVGPTEFNASLDGLRTFIIQRIDESNNEILSKINTLDRIFREALLHRDEAYRHSLQSVSQDNQRQDMLSGCSVSGSEIVGLSNQLYGLSGQISTVESALRVMVAANRHLLSRDLVACVPAGCSVEADANAGQHSCSARKRRRFDVATGCPAVRDLFATVSCSCFCEMYIGRLGLRFRATDSILNEYFLDCVLCFEPVNRSFSPAIPIVSGRFLGTQALQLVVVLTQLVVSQEVSGRQRFRLRGQQFKKKLGSGSSGSGSSSSSGSRTEFCGFCGGKHPSMQCVGVQGSCNLCDQYGHFARMCPSAGSQQTPAQPQGRGVLSRDLVACVPAGCSAEADVNAGQHSCSARRKRRRFDVATGCPAARDLFATVACSW
ncbi:hypothetical protein F511_03572 [Dorcoceras hygrometricum]|uniref:CCHC-type domain-containing protein n=1 Tax=Dorcoceras hygrometricum TaxID=472368 RepID=A0A2Z7DCD8_9LAMI|nr:hypothetical protein F511_03572 [Dorcoceras hygrometricum]